MLPLRAYQKTILYTLLHFIVDGICALIIFQYLYTESETTCLIVFLIYNLLAFVSQPFVGLLIDRWNCPKGFLLISVIMLSLGYLFHFQFVVASLCLGIGNAFFHVCGGKDVCTSTKNDIASLGIFVSTGAIGLVVGQRYFSDTLCIVFYSLFYLFSLGILLARNKEESIETDSAIREKLKGVGLLLAGLAFVVAVRSFVGKIIILDFEVTSFVFILIALATCLGKMAGGFMVKWLGISKTILVSMIVAIPCLTLWNTNPYSLCLGIFMFNFSMPITLWLSNQCCPNKEGFAFGLLAAALIPGYFIGMLPMHSLFVQLMIVGLSLLSIGLVLWIEKRYKKDGLI